MEAALRKGSVALGYLKARGLATTPRAERLLHDVILGVKNEARALYGPSSDQVAALGLKKKSEQSKRTRVKKAAEG